MKILFAASEAAPFIKSGGLGDVLGALPAQLSQNTETEISVILPYYSVIRCSEKFDIEFVKEFDMMLAWRSCHTKIYKTEIKKRGGGRRKGTRVVYYFIDNEQYFDREGIYGYEDDGERYAYFSKAVLETLRHIDFQPEIIHCNDWQTGFVPLFLKTIYKEDLKFQKIRTVFTIHNIEYQGRANPDFLENVLGISEDFRGAATWDGMINAMKCAIVLCDKLTTVSKTYANEIKYEYFAHGLDAIIRENSYKTSGIVNGIDEVLYNPEKDDKLDYNYSPSKMQGKEECKKAMQIKLSLPQRDVPMIAMITRLVDHKGLQLVEGVLSEMLNLDIQFVVLGSGDSRYERLFSCAAAEYPDKVSANIMFDPVFANRLYAASDFFLMPSKCEPCGLSQLIAMRYGSIPIVRETGGLADTVPPLNIDTMEGVGFTFKNFNAHDMLYVIEQANKFYYDKNNFKRHRREIMKIESSWANSAKEYVKLYEELVL